MKIYRFTGDNVSGGVHGSWFTVIADNKEEAKKMIMDKLKENSHYEIDDNWELDEEVSEEEIGKGIIDWDAGDCC